MKAFPILSYPCAGDIGSTVGKIVKSPELLAALMEAVVKKYGCDAVVPMDLSVEAESFGADIRFTENTVPVVEGELIKTAEDAEKLSVPSVYGGRTEMFVNSVKLAKEAMPGTKIYAGVSGPFSLAARLCGVTDIIYLCIDEPETVETVAEKCTAFIYEYIKAFREAGADGIIIAEPVADLLSPSLEEEFSAPYIKKLTELQSDGFEFIYHNCGAGVTKMAESIYSNGCAAYHFGNAVPLEEMLKKAPKDKIVMGNLDPVGLFRDGTAEDMKNAVRELFERCGAYKNFVPSSGCDLPADAKEENIKAFFETAMEFGF